MSAPTDPEKYADWLKKKSDTLKGKNLSEEHKRKISEALKGNTNGTGHKIPDNLRQKLIDSRTGSRHTADTRAKMRNAKLGRLRGPHSELHRQKISEAQRGNKNHNYKDGRSVNVYNYEFTVALKSQIRERDGNECVLCGASVGDSSHGLHVHHIDFSKSNHKSDNLITLCTGCHKDVHDGKVVIRNIDDWENVER